MSRFVNINTLLVSGFAIILVAVSGLRPVGFDPDSLNYANVVSNDAVGSLFGVREPTFWLINLASQMSPLPAVTTFFLIYAIAGVSIKSLAILRLSERPLFSLFLYLMLYFVIHEMTQIRTGVAAAIYLFALHALHRGQLRVFLLLIALATSFHFSAVVGLLALFGKYLGRSKLLLLALPVVGFIFSMVVTAENLQLVGSYLLPSPIQTRLVFYLELILEDRFSQINLFNPISISFLLLYLILVFKIPTSATGFDRLLLVSLGIGVSAFYGLSILPVMAFRVMEFMNITVILLLPTVSRWFQQPKLACFLIISWAASVFVIQSLILLLDLV